MYRREITQANIRSYGLIPLKACDILNENSVSRHLIWQFAFALTTQRIGILPHICYNFLQNKQAVYKSSLLIIYLHICVLLFYIFAFMPPNYPLTISMVLPI